jgi:hypothetical protein
MRTQVKRPNGEKIPSTSFKTILEQMKKLTDGGNIRVANKHWDIYQKVNNINYSNAPIGA